MLVKNQFIDLCRICMKESSPNVSFGNPLYSDRDITVLDALGVVIGCEISISDSLPHCLCSVCFVHLQISHNFKIQFVDTQRILLAKILESHIEEELHQDELIIKDDIPIDSNGILLNDSRDETIENNEMAVCQVSNENSIIPIDSPEHFPENSNQNSCEIPPEQTAEEATNSIDDASEIDELFENESDITNIIEQYQCNMCDFQTVNIANLQRHIDRDHTKKIYTCKHCDYQTSIDSELTNHLRMNHLNLIPANLIPKRLKCDFCQYSIEKSWELKQHVLNVHKSAKVYQCRMCQHVAYSLNHHQLHINAKHKRPDVSSLLQSSIPVQAKPRNQVKVLPRRRNNVVDAVETLEISSDEEDTNRIENNGGHNDGVALPNNESTSLLKELLTKRTLDDTDDKRPKKLKMDTSHIFECGLCVGSCEFNSNCYLTFLRHRDLCHPGLCESKCPHCAYRTFSNKHFQNHLQNAHIKVRHQRENELGLNNSEHKKTVVNS